MIDTSWFVRSAPSLVITLHSPSRRAKLFMQYSSDCDLMSYMYGPEKLIGIAYDYTLPRKNFSPILPASVTGIDEAMTIVFPLFICVSFGGKVKMS